MSSIINRHMNSLQNNALYCKEKQHTILKRGRHFCRIFPKGKMSIQSEGKNHMSCLLPRYRKRKYRKERQCDQDNSCRRRLYKQLPIKTGKHYNIKNLYSCY